MKILLLACFAPLALVFAQTSQAQPASQAQSAGPAHWVATWTTPQPLIRAQPRPPAPANAAQGRGGNPALRAIATNGFHNQTVRMIVHTSIGGTRVRIRLENAFGATPVAIGAAHIAFRNKDSGILPASDRALTFSGRPGKRNSTGTVAVVRT